MITMTTDLTTFEYLINKLPENIISALKFAEQDPIYHKEGAVYIHLNLVYNQVLIEFGKHDTDMLITAIFHDLGKLETETKVIKDNILRIHHIGHEFKSLDYIDNYIQLYSEFTPNIERIKEIVKNHMRAGLYSSGQMKNIAKRKKFESLKYFNDIMKFLKCDQTGKI